MESLMSELKLRDMAGPAIAAVFVIGVVLAAGAVIAPFFISIVWGAIIAVAVWRPFGRVRRKLFRGHTTAAAAVAVILMFTAVFSPFAIGAWGVYQKASDFSAELAAAAAEERSAEKPGDDGAAAPVTAGEKAEAARKIILERTRERVSDVAEKAGDLPVVGGFFSDLWDSFSHKRIDFRGMAIKAVSFVPDTAQIVVRVAKSMTGGMVMFAMSLLFAGYFFAAGPVFARLLRRLSVRIGGKRALSYIDQSVAGVRSVVYGFIAAAAAQGATALIGLAAAGVDHAFVLAIIAGVFSVVPGGPALVGFFGAYQLYAGGSPVASLCLIAWFMLVVCNVDNLVKGIIINRCGGSSLPFVIVFISVIGGAFAFGLLGVFIGPVIMTLLASMIRAYMNGDSELAGGKPQEQDCTASADSETEQVPSSGGAPEGDGGSESRGEQTDSALS